MIAGATIATGVVSSSLSTLAIAAINHVIYGTFNPSYNKLDRKRMRHIQRKYILAYEGQGVEGQDRSLIISGIDPTSRLLLNPEGTKPMNPFHDEAQFEESLIVNFHAVSGHQGRFVASHALTCIGTINDYQNKRRQRTWVPGVSSPGKPNDYINMFLEETKQWMRTQMTLDAIESDELRRRDLFYTKLKNDNYFWCFPPEGGENSSSIHRVIDFVHAKVRNALELISREEKNKSLQMFFKELNNHTTNAFEFGKQFLAYVMYPSKSITGNLLSSQVFDGRTYETGKLHKLLETATHAVFASYVEDMNQTADRMNSLANPNHLLSMGNNNNNNNNNSNNNNGSGNTALNLMNSNTNTPLMITNSTNDSINNKADNNMNSSSLITVSNTNANTNSTDNCDYIIEITEYDESYFSSPLYVIELCDPNGHRWIVRRSFNEFSTLDKKLSLDEKASVEMIESLNFPIKINNTIMKSKDNYFEICNLLQEYLLRMFKVLINFSTVSQDLVCQFIEVKQLILSSNNKSLKRAEHVPNVFICLKDDFKKMLMLTRDEMKKINGDGSNSNISKAMVEFRKVWGIDMTLKVFEAYALLQRMATVLGWTLEINHFFLSMFGNTLAFSKLPLRAILFTQKDIMNKFISICDELFRFASQLHTESKYKWHKNLQMAENHLSRTRFHIDKCLSIIGQIDAEHLDYDAQMRRLKDVHARFQPLLNRIDNSLTFIQDELALPMHHQIRQERVEVIEAPNSSNVNIISKNNSNNNNNKNNNNNNNNNNNHSNHHNRISNQSHHQSNNTVYIVDESSNDHNKSSSDSSNSKDNDYIVDEVDDNDAQHMQNLIGNNAYEEPHYDDDIDDDTNDEEEEVMATSTQNRVNNNTAAAAAATGGLQHNRSDNMQSSFKEVFSCGRTDKDSSVVCIIN